ncbi:pantoate--beta-alanine ligase [Rhodobacterales bacterium 52_120_T64]|nr:pantoate--beta-alanine ligase [Rhodobacterales bacterium 52_120_T64]
MKVCNTKKEIRTVRDEFRAQGASVGLVPTMGYLHKGHIELVKQARATCDRVIATIFVNPTQFGPNEDLSSYPRDLERDFAMLQDEGVDAVFVPSPQDMYLLGSETVVETKRLSRILIGRIRPGHFQGVTTVVTKLFNICQPDYAYFGEKDYQQLQVIKRMVRDLDVPVEIKGVPTVREGDGLAMSSRNIMLTPEDRIAAVALSRALNAAEEMCVSQSVTARLLSNTIRSRLEEEPRADVQSVDIRDAETLTSIRGRIERSVVALIAVRFGSVLLIDQRVVTPSQVHLQKA